MQSPAGESRHAVGIVFAEEVDTDRIGGYAEHSLDFLEKVRF